MKNKLVLLGLGSAGLSTFLATLGVCVLNDNLSHPLHLVSAATFLGLFSIMAFVASKLYRE